MFSGWVNHILTISSCTPVVSLSIRKFPTASNEKDRTVKTEEKGNQE